MEKKKEFRLSSSFELQLMNFSNSELEGSKKRDQQNKPECCVMCTKSGMFPSLLLPSNGMNTATGGNLLSL